MDKLESMGLVGREEEGVEQYDIIEYCSES